MSWVLVVDDDDSTRLLLSEVLRREGYEVDAARDGEEALSKIKGMDFSAVLLDIRMPGTNGVDVLAAIKEHGPSAPVIMMTAYATVETAVEAMKRGAYDYLTKPLRLEEVKAAVRRATDLFRLTRENIYLRQELGDRRGLSDIVGVSPAMREVLGLVEKVAGSRTTVLIQGESGTGKELVAHAIHQLSLRSGSPLVKFNCGALAEGVLESELFGHEKGAFTGAYSRRTGRFELAQGGTIFLDEISEATPSMQVKLLRVLEEGEFERVGGSAPIKIDARVICATNKDLKKMVSQGTFREDLYYRLNVFPISLPPLRERREDIKHLAEYFLEKLRVNVHKNLASLAPEALDKLLSYVWPGNVRELRNVIERAMILAEGSEIRPDHIILQGGEVYNEWSDDSKIVPLKEAGKEAASRVEKELIEKALRLTNYNRTQAAEILGVSYRALSYKIKAYGLDNGRKDFS